MNCIQQRRVERHRTVELGQNHMRFCTYCEDDATHHANVGYWCGNVCEKHARKFGAGQVEKGVFLVASFAHGSGESG